jgi:outer membrane lipoprotein-sorting protein
LKSIIYINGLTFLRLRIQSSFKTALSGMYNNAANLILRLLMSKLCLTLALLTALAAAGTAGAENYSLASSNPVPISARQAAWVEGANFIESLQRSSAVLKNYSFHYRMLVFKARKKAQDESGVFYFKHPRLMRSEVLSGSRKGALAVLGADGKIRGHLGGLLKMFQATVASDSQWAKLPNGYPMAEADYLSLASYLQNMLKSGNLSRVTPEPVNNKYVSQKTYVLEVYQKLAGVQLPVKRVFVDPPSNLPVAWEDYTNGRLSALTTWSQVNLNADIPNQLFKI